MNNPSEPNSQKETPKQPSVSSSSKAKKKLPTVDPAKTIPYLRAGLKKSR
jgi:hypothetical protein